jgi:hypothetical protein
MREIKFRIWGHKLYGEGKEMRLPSDEENDDVDCYRYLLNLRGESQCCGGEDDVLMQYTGLKDKNGKDIYEGDTVKRGDVLYKVIWSKPNAMFYMVSKNGRALFNDYTDKSKNVVEVIGNIYENPELLNK